MSVGLLLITHDRLGDELLGIAATMFGAFPLAVRAMAVGKDDDPDRGLAQGRRLADELDDGDGVLLLTDLYGSTPSNIALRVAERGDCRVVYGINLPMLVRVLNYPTLDLTRLATKALSGGREGIIGDGEA